MRTFIIGLLLMIMLFIGVVGMSINSIADGFLGPSKTDRVMTLVEEKSGHRWIGTVTDLDLILYGTVNNAALAKAGYSHDGWMIQAEKISEIEDDKTDIYYATIYSIDDDGNKTKMEVVLFGL